MTYARLLDCNIYVTREDARQQLGTLCLNLSQRCGRPLPGILGC